MAVVRTERMDLHVNGDGAYAFVARLDDTNVRPGVVLIQEWWGLEPHIRDLAQRLAAEGFVAAVPDLYHGKVATEPDDAQKMVMTLASNMQRAIAEINGAIDALTARSDVQPKKVGLIGFCVGGRLAYKAAESSSSLAAVCSFYGGDMIRVPRTWRRLPRRFAPFTARKILACRRHRSTSCAVCSGRQVRISRRTHTQPGMRS